MRNRRRILNIVREIERMADDWGSDSVIRRMSSLNCEVNVGII